METVEDGWGRWVDGGGTGTGRDGDGDGRGRDAVRFGIFTVSIWQRRLSSNGLVGRLVSRVSIFLN